MNKHIRIIKLGILTENMDSNYIGIHDYMLNVLKNIKLLDFNKMEEYIYNHIGFYGINKNELYIGYNGQSGAIWIDEVINEKLFKCKNIHTYISKEEMSDIINFYIIDYFNLGFKVQRNCLFIDDIYKFFHISLMTI